MRTTFMAETIEELTAQAKRLIAERRYEDAVRVCRRGLLGQPEHVAMRVLLGEALLANERYDETRVEMLALTKKHPDEASAHRILGEAYLRSGQTAKARESLEQASIRGDSVAAELLSEARAEPLVESHTIERWFGQGPEESKTVETSLPAFTEEDTPPPRKLPIPGAAVEESIQIDPAFAREASLITKEDDPPDATLHSMPGAETGGHGAIPAVAAEGLRALLAKVQAAPAKKPFFVPPPSAKAPATSKTSPLAEVRTIAKPSVAKPAPRLLPGPTPGPPVGRPAPWAIGDVKTTPQPKHVKLPAGILGDGPASRAEPVTSELSIADLGRSQEELTSDELQEGDGGDDDQTRPISSAMVAEAERLAAGPTPASPPARSPGTLPPPPARPSASSRPPAPAPWRRTTLQGVTSPLAREPRPQAPAQAEREAPRSRPPPPAGPPRAPAPAAPPPPSGQRRKQTLMGVPMAPPPPAAPPPRAAPPPHLHEPPRAPEPPPLSESGPLPQTMPEIVNPPIRPAPMAVVAPRPFVPPTPAPMAAPAPARMPAPVAAPAPAPPRPPPAPSITGAVTARMEEARTDPRRASPNRSRDEITGSRTRPDARKLAAVIGTALLVVVALSVAVHWVRQGNRAAALAALVATASDEGRPTSIEGALSELEGDDAPEIVALRARLLATRAIEMGIGDWTDADAELTALDTAGGALLDATVARALVSLARGQADQAATLLSGVEGTDVALAEALHAQALALEALGQLAQANEAARQAATLRPNAPRHASLSARLELVLGDSPRAVATLATATNGDRSPLVRLVRARIALASGDFVATDVEARAVLTDLASEASPLDLANGQALRARAFLGVGDRQGARTALDAAAELRPLSDEVFALELAEGYLAVGATDRASTLISALGSTSSNPARRARVIVEVALAANDLTAADAALVGLGATPQGDLLRARVREAQNRPDEARMLYERAASDPALALEARSREGELLVRIHRPGDARMVLEQALRVAPTNAHLAELFVRVAVETGDLAAAEAAMGPALAANPTSSVLHAAHAQILLSRGHPAEALAELRAVAAAAPSDAQIQLALADAAYATGDRVTAVAAYETVIRLAETAAAHLAIAGVLAEDARFDDATTHVDRAAAMGAPALALTQLRVRLTVMRGLGASALEQARAATDANGSDGTLWALRATLEVQAEDFPSALASVTRALRLSPTSADALLVKVLLAIEEGDLTGASRAIDRAARAGHGPSFDARIRTLRGRLRFEAGDEAGAHRLTDEALALDSHCGAAYLLLADLAIGEHGDPVPHLRAAVGATGTPPEAIGRLSMRLRSGTEACAFGRAYLDRAPTGYDVEAVNDVVRHCRS